MGSFLLTLRRSFVADHFHDLPGFVEARHGHNWEIAATALLEREDEDQPFEAQLEAWVASVDYTLLNDQPRLLGRNPTAESLAEWAYQQLSEGCMKVVSVRIREKANYWAEVANSSGLDEGAA